MWSPYENNFFHVINDIENCPRTDFFDSSDSGSKMPIHSESHFQMEMSTLPHSLSYLRFHFIRKGLNGVSHFFCGRKGDASFFGRKELQWVNDDNLKISTSQIDKYIHIFLFNKSPLNCVEFIKRNWDMYALNYRCIHTTPGKNKKIL